MPAHTSSVAPSRELLLANHRFPGAYLVKAFGPASDAFIEAIAQAGADVVGESRAHVQQRTSSRGSKVCVTLTLNAFTVDEVIEVYERIHRVADVKMVL